MDIKVIFYELGKSTNYNPNTKLYSVYSKLNYKISVYLKFIENAQI